MNVKVICGIAVNDWEGDTADCSIYACWKNMIQRVFNPKVKAKNPSYDSCTVHPEWLSFSAFRAWAIEQNPQGKQLDKDLLVKGNKHYAPETCLFISHAVNSFLTERERGRGDWPLGVYWHKASGKFMARCGALGSNKRIYLGLFDEPDKAHQAWKREKYNQARALACVQNDERVKIALLNRYNFEEENV